MIKIKMKERIEVIKPMIRPVEIYQEESVEEEPKTIVEEAVKQEVVEMEKPFSNKLRLLNRRAELGRYVLVSLKTHDSIYEGLFKGIEDNELMIEVNDTNVRIGIDEVMEVIILRV